MKLEKLEVKEESFLLFDGRPKCRLQVIDDVALLDIIRQECDNVYLWTLTH